MFYSSRDADLLSKTTDADYLYHGLTFLALYPLPPPLPPPAAAVKQVHKTDASKKNKKRNCSKTLFIQCGEGRPTGRLHQLIVWLGAPDWATERVVVGSRWKSINRFLCKRGGRRRKGGGEDRKNERKRWNLGKTVGNESHLYLFNLLPE